MFLRRLIPCFLVAIICMTNCGHVYNELTGDGIVTVGVYVDEGASGICYGAAEKMFEWMGFEIERLYASTINEGNLDDIDIFYFPGGNAGLYDSYITETGKQRLRNLINEGRAFIGTCAGAYFAAHYLNVFPATVGGPVPGLDFEMCQVYLIKGHPITNSLPAFYWIMYANSPFFEPDSGAVMDTIGFYNVSGYPALVACEYGEGRVFLTGPHPEWEEDSDRDGVSAYDNYDDVESDWPLMRSAARWCLRDFEE